ncbi:hypothetical protein ARMGADRAFT_104008 [Armillaria gallica]|uniref:Uncharacterized protein n=1 Tax=Armillaria gallica TaxID=47427 RepID=A0A2H3C9N9_ARMGA|nr:hypothetical protein ARMGADRAFT_104008 [Armillaria gallica]
MPRARARTRNNEELNGVRTLKPALKAAIFKAAILRGMNCSDIYQAGESYYGKDEDVIFFLFPPFFCDAKRVRELINIFPQHRVRQRLSAHPRAVHSLTRIARRNPLSSFRPPLKECYQSRVVPIHEDTQNADHAFYHALSLKVVIILVGRLASPPFP